MSSTQNQPNIYIYKCTSFSFFFHISFIIYIRGSIYLPERLSRLHTAVYNSLSSCNPQFRVEVILKLKRKAEKKERTKKRRKGGKGKKKGQLNSGKIDFQSFGTQKHSTRGATKDEQKRGLEFHVSSQNLFSHTHVPQNK